jgi:hypothetical protein
LQLDRAWVVTVREGQLSRTHGYPSREEALRDSDSRYLYAQEIRGDEERERLRLIGAARDAHTIRHLVGPTGSFDLKLAVGGEWGRTSILEVVMRLPEVFVRSLSHQDAVKLKRMSTRA